MEVPITLAAGDSTVIAVTPFARVPAAGVHAVSTTGGEILDTGGELVLRATSPGRYSAVMSNGRTVEVGIPTVPATMPLTDWHLTVSDWRQGADGKLVKTTHNLDLHGLNAWPDIPELQDVSGIGTYSTTVDIGPEWTGGQGAYLNLGQVLGTFDVTVNGRSLPAVNQITATVDMGPYLKPGTNTIVVEVATTLRNRLRVTPGFPGQAAEPRQQVGLVGPVLLIPYGQVVLLREG